MMDGQISVMEGKMADFPRDWRAFKKWREERVFADREQANRAYRVECDLRMLPELDPAINVNTIAICKKNIDNFAAELDAMKQKAQG